MLGDTQCGKILTIIYAELNALGNRSSLKSSPKKTVND